MRSNTQEGTRDASTHTHSRMGGGGNVVTLTLLGHHSKINGEARLTALRLGRGDRADNRCERVAPDAGLQQFGQLRVPERHVLLLRRGGDDDVFQRTEEVSTAVCE